LRNQAPTGHADRQPVDSRTKPRKLWMTVGAVGRLVE
jgi:hypothetical protein